ncbi:MAG: hypothetical protein AB7L76_17045 [Burkholderiaceae bacterium]
MRRLIILLVCANLLVFAWARGAFTPWLAAEREPRLLDEQIHPERLQVLRSEAGAPEAGPGSAGPGSAGPGATGAGATGARATGAGATAAGAAAAGASGAAAAGSAPSGAAVRSAPPGSGGAAAGAATASGAAAAGAAGSSAGAAAGAAAGAGTAIGAAANAGGPPGSCWLFAAVDDERGRRLREALESAGAAVSTQRIELGASYLVYVPPSESMTEAQRRLAELRRAGLVDVFLMQDGPFRLGISLGLFRTEEAARTLVSRVGDLGVPDARVAARPPFTTRVRLQARWPDARGAAAAASLGTQFDAPARDCAAAAG